MKIGWAGWGVDEMPRPCDHQNITVENVFVEEWDAPYCVVQAPVRNLTLRGLRGQHTGPLFYNLENDLESVTLSDCQTTLSGDPPTTLINESHRRQLENEIFNAAVLDRTPGVITVDRAPTVLILVSSTLV